MPRKIRATKQHLPDSTASAAARTMVGNQSASAVSCRAEGRWSLRECGPLQPADLCARLSRGCERSGEGKNKREREGE